MEPLSRDFPLILDGGTSTELMAMGYEWGKCQPEFILEHRGEVVKLQQDFVKAGSNVIYTPTFGANAAVLETFGLFEKTAELNRAMAEISIEARGGDKNVLIAGDIGPCYGVEPEPSFGELMALYARQVKALDEYVDFFVVETMTSLRQMRAAFLACKKTGKQVFVTMPVNDHGNAYETGLPAEVALVIMQAMGADAFGFNCSRPEDTVSAIKKVLPFAKIPLIAKPCHGIWDGEKGYTLSPEETAGTYAELGRLGVRILGGCCGTAPQHISMIKKTAVSPDTENKQDTAFVFASEEQLFYLQPETTEFSAHIECKDDLGEVISHICDSDEGRIDILRISINTPDDALNFAEHAHMATLPVMFCSHDELALKMALLHYHGRALIDSETSIEKETLDEIAEKYGAVVY